MIEGGMSRIVADYAEFVVDCGQTQTSYDIAPIQRG
jgi:hypothetical protein